MKSQIMKAVNKNPNNLKKKSGTQSKTKTKSMSMTKSKSMTKSESKSKSKFMTKSKTKLNGSTRKLSHTKLKNKIFIKSDPSVEMTATPEEKPEVSKNPEFVKWLEERKKKIGAVSSMISRPDCGAIVIRNIRHLVTEQQLRDQLKRFGHVTLLNLCNSDKTDSSRNKAHVCFRDAGAAQQAAIALHCRVFLNKVVKVFYIPPLDLRPAMFMKKVDQSKMASMSGYKMAAMGGFNMAEFESSERAEIQEMKSLLESE